VTDVVDALPGEQDDREDAAVTDQPDNLRGLLLVIGLLGLLGLWSVPGLLIVLAIVFFVFMHELGHFMTARWTGMKTTEFFVGFGPRIFSFRRGETTFGLKAILGGAYVRIIGLTNLEDVDPADEPRTFRQQSYPKRMLVMSAGSAMHFLMAIVLFFISYGIVGFEREDAWTITAPSDESAAESAGLAQGDRLVSIDGESVATFDDLIVAVAPRAARSVEIVFERDGATNIVTTTIGSRDTLDRGTVGFLGVGAEYEPVRDSLPKAAWRSVSEFPDRIWDSLTGMGQFVSNIGGFVDRIFTAPGAETAQADESRPLSIIGVVQIGSQLGGSVVWLLAFFNVFIGVFNLLPLLPLDGGHIAIATYERARSRPGRRYVLDITRLLPVTYAVFVFLVFLGLGAIWLDIANPATL